jgi:hypothetical protein
MWVGRFSSLCGSGADVTGLYCGDLLDGDPVCLASFELDGAACRASARADVRLIVSVDHPSAIHGIQRQAGPAARELFPDEFATTPSFLCFLFFVRQADECATHVSQRNVAGLLSGRFKPLTDPHCSVHVELPVHALLPWREGTGRLRHRDYLGAVDLVRVAVGHNGGRAFIEDVLQPIGALAIREGDQEGVIMPGRDDRCLVCPA